MVIILWLILITHVGEATATFHPYGLITWWSFLNPDGKIEIALLTDTPKKMLVIWGSHLTGDRWNLLKFPMNYCIPSFFLRFLDEKWMIEKFWLLPKLSIDPRCRWFMAAVTLGLRSREDGHRFIRFIHLKMLVHLYPKVVPPRIRSRWSRLALSLFADKWKVRRGDIVHLAIYAPPCKVHGISHRFGTHRTEAPAKQRHPTQPFSGCWRIEKNPVLRGQKVSMINKMNYPKNIKEICVNVTHMSPLSSPINHQISKYPLVDIQKTNWTITMLLMEKSTINGHVQ